jgi:hypothetical protein
LLGVEEKLNTTRRGEITDFGDGISKRGRRVNVSRESVEGLTTRSSEPEQLAK